MASKRTQNSGEARAMASGKTFRKLIIYSSRNRGKVLIFLKPSMVKQFQYLVVLSGDDGGDKI